MTLIEFTAALESEFEEVAPGTLTPNSNYRDLEGWSSMHALIVIAFIDAHYDIILTATELKQAHTVSELYAIVTSKTA